MASRTIMLVDLAVEPTRQREFDDFYHDFYIPEFLKAVPEVSTARRFVQTNAGQSPNELVHYLTIYELVSDQAPEAIDAAIARCAHREASEQFKHWKQSGLTYFDRAYYAEAYSSEHECATSVLWRSEYVRAIFWSMPQESSGDTAKQVAATIATELTTVPAVQAARTYEKPGDNRCSSFMSVLAISDSTAAQESLSAAGEIFSRHAQKMQTGPTVAQSMTLQLIFSLLPHTEQV